MTQSAPSRQGIEVPPAGSYDIDPEHSAITFTTRHLFGIAPVRGTFGLRDGRIHVAAPVSESTAQACVTVASFRTGNDARDATVLSPQLLDAAAHPTIRFSAHAIAALTEAAGQWTLHGSLEVRGVTRPVNVVIDHVSCYGGTLRVACHARVDRYAFGVTGYRGLAARWLRLDLDITADARNDR